MPTAPSCALQVQRDQPVSDDRNQSADVFVHSCVTGQTEPSASATRGQEGNDIAIPPSISGGGRFVASASFASNLLAG